MWQSIAASFHAAHPNVTIKNVPIQNEQFTTKIPLALQSSNPPDIYQQWGGGQEATQVKSGKLVNLTPSASGWIGELGNAAAGWQVNGQQYGVPFDLHAVGFWYRKDLFAKAGITAAPTTIPSWKRTSPSSRRTTSCRSPSAARTAGRTRSGGSTSRVRECSTSVLKQSMSSINLSAPASPRRART